jgi:diadenosine tetraphosphate (Ap4A) HIT family hydrolase
MPADHETLTPNRPSKPCPFCHLNPDENLILHDGIDFFAMADFAPQAAAHVLIIPRQHLACLAVMPASMDEEFGALKQRFGDFVLEAYGELTYWENGVFGQSVPHAHQHVMSVSFDTTLYADAGPAFETPADLRALYDASPGHYFTVEHAGVSRYLPPDLEIHRSLLRYGRETMGGLRLLTPQQRREAAQPYLDTLLKRWQRYSAKTAR